MSDFVCVRTITSTAIIAPPDYRLSPMPQVRSHHNIGKSQEIPIVETSRKRFVRVLEPITKIRERLTSCKKVDSNVENFVNYV